MQYALAFKYFLDRPGGFVNLLLVMVCLFFIPVVGPIVALGYRAEVVEALIRDPELRRHPKFQFERFVEYLTRGIWPFVIGLVISLPFGVLLMLAFFGGMLINPPGPNNPPVLAFVLMGCVYVVGIVAMMALSVPMMFHAKVTAKLDFRGAFRFTVDFWKLVGGAAVVTGLVFIPASFVIGLIGFLLCFVGIYPASTITTFAADHLMVQLYLEYLDRGGQTFDHVVPEDEWHRGEPEEYRMGD